MDHAHLGPESLWYKLSSRFYWKRMKVEIKQFCRTCDVCQKTKDTNFAKFGYL
ncbi:hypothetical protein BDZ89DRAFT_945967, partial [Hymenopellis radicata]